MRECVAAVALAATSGCGEAPVRDGARDVAEDPPRILAHGASIGTDKPLQATVRVSLSRPARVFVEYGNPVAGKFRTAPSAVAANHALPLARLRANTEYRYVVGSGDDAGVGVASGSFKTGGLPARLNAVRVDVAGRSTQPLLLADLQIEDLDTRWQGGWFLAWDEVGKIVWYHEAVPPAGAPAGTWEVKTSAITRLSNGNFIYIHRHCCLVEITPLGDMVGTSMFGEEIGRPHHDILIQDDGRLLYPSLEWFDLETADGAKARTPTHTLRLLDRRTNTTKIVWNAEDRWNEHVAEEDVTNINSVSLGPRGNYLVSARVRNAIISLAADFQTVEWQLGGADGDFVFPDPRDRFYHQHTAAELENGNVVLFDNGDSRPESEGGLYSRALELRLDHGGKQARKVWEHRVDGLYSPYISSAFRLANGNTLVNYGVQGDESTMAPVVLVEVDPMENEVFRVELGRLSTVAYHRYRGHGLASINGETMLRAPLARQSAAPLPQPR